jgi:2TM domain
VWFPEVSILRKEVRYMESITEQRHKQKIHVFYMNLLVYLIVNAALVVFVAAGITHLIPPGFFWPIVSIVVWGVALTIAGYRTYRGNV